MFVRNAFIIVAIHILVAVTATATPRTFHVDGNVGARLHDAKGRIVKRLFAGNPHLVPMETIKFTFTIDRENRFAQVQGSADAFFYANNDWQGDAQPSDPNPIKLTFMATWFGDQLFFDRDPLTGFDVDVIGRPGTLFSGFLQLEGPQVDGGIQIVPLEDIYTGVEAVWAKWLVNGQGLNVISGQDAAAPDYVYKGNVMSAWIASQGYVKIGGYSFKFKGDFHGEIQPKPPICEASPDGQAVTEVCLGESVSVTLDGSASSDPSGGELAYLWSTNCPGIIDPVTSQMTTLTITAENLLNDLSCEAFLTVINDQGLSEQCSVPVNITACPLDCDEVPIDRPGIDIRSFELADIARRAANKVIKQSDLRRQRRFARRAKRESKQLATITWEALATLDDVIPSCPQNPLCVSSSNSDVIITNEQNALDIRVLIDQLVRRLRRVNGRPRAGRKFLERGDILVSEITALNSQIPEVQSTCNF